MATITREELLKIAKLSSLKLDDQEIPRFVDQVNTILGYVARLSEVQLTDQAAPIKNVNVLRDDVVVTTDAATILEEAPQVEGGYFVVPKILEEK